MMFQVQWSETALDEIAEIWMRAADRPAITAAVERIDQRLAKDPADQGESRERGRRLILEPPLGLTFRVRPHDRTVIVLHVWSFEKRRPGS